jgi:hypothetical protein
MSVARRVSEILDEHVTLTIEGIDRMYLNGYIPRLQSPEGVAGFFRFHRGYKFASSALMDPISKAFIAAIEDFASAGQIPLITFRKGERKEDIAAKMRKGFVADEGVVFIGKAQEKSSVFRTEKRTNPKTGHKYPWIVRGSALVNQYYFYIVDRNFGPLFIKFGSYFPYTAKLCINGHEWLKQQLKQEGIAYEALDNGILSCADPARVQQIADSLSAEKIDALLRKWLRRLPHPFTAADRDAGYRYDISILQAEFSRTMVMDRPVTGRVWFEEVIRENLDLGRPDQVQMIFGRRVTKTTPGRFRTRVLTQGVIPSIHVHYKNARIKEYYKEGRALRVETTINDTRDFRIGKRLKNLPQLREIGFSANRRLLDVQRISHDCAVGEEAWNTVVRPVQVGEQRASALRFDDPRAQALFAAMLLFVFQTEGFASKQLRGPLAQLLGLDPATMTQARMTYDLRRLRLHGIIERIPHSHRYRVTSFGLRTAMFLSRTWSRLLRPGLSLIAPPAPDHGAQLRTLFDKLDHAIELFANQQKAA